MIQTSPSWDPGPHRSCRFGLRGLPSVAGVLLKQRYKMLGATGCHPQDPHLKQTLLHKAAPLPKSHISTVTNEHLRPYLSWIHSRSSYEPLASTHRSPTHRESTPRALSLAHRYSAESGAAPSSPWHPGLPRRHFSQPRNICGLTACRQAATSAHVIQCMAACVNMQTTPLPHSPQQPGSCL